MPQMMDDLLNPIGIPGIYASISRLAPERLLFQGIFDP